LLTQAHDRAYTSLESQYRIPSQSCFGIGLGMVAPTILAHAIDEVKTRYLPGLYRGDLIASQLFSEPGAGSDLAGLQTRAVRDGEEWIVNGQKVWTSGAHYSDIGEIICRTDPDQPKHRGLTGFVVDLKAPGVEIRPLRQMTGGASFNEVFFTDVRIPDDHRLGDVGQGWTVALTTGAKHATSNYAVLYTAKGVATAIGALGLGAFLYEQTGSWATGFYISAVMALVAALLAVGLRASQVTAKAKASKVPVPA
jgi:acyl-CoA dehydrogenase